MQDQSEQIFIIGAGAIGKALAVCLQLAGRRVTLVRGSVNDGGTSIQFIKVVFPDGTNKQAEIPVTTLAAYKSLDGIVALTSKSYGNQLLAESLKSKIGHSPIVLLQNGLEVEQPFIEQGFLQVYRCVLFVTSQLIDETSISFKPVAACPVGLVKGNPDQTDQITAILNTPAFGFKAEIDINTIVWKKAIINCVFNSVCPLLDIDNGVFYRDMQALAIARTVIAECTAIARDKGILLNVAEIEESLLQISRSSDGQLISTLQDIRNSRRTEIDTLNFAIAGIAESLNKAEMVATTRLLGELTKIKADLNIKSIP